MFKQALSIREQRLGLHHPFVAETLHGLASVYISQNRYIAAAPCYSRILAICKESLGSQHRKTKEAEEEYLILLQVLGQEEETAMLEQNS